MRERAPRDLRRDYRFGIREREDGKGREEERGFRRREPRDDRFRNSDRDYPRREGQEDLTKLFFRKIPTNITPKLLWEELGRFGTMIEHTLTRKNNAIVKYSNAQEAADVLQAIKNHKIFPEFPGVGVEYWSDKRLDQDPRGGPGPTYPERSIPATIPRKQTPNVDSDMPPQENSEVKPSLTSNSNQSSPNPFDPICSPYSPQPLKETSENDKKEQVGGDPMEEHLSDDDKITEEFEEAPPNEKKNYFGKELHYSDSPQENSVEFHPPEDDMNMVPEEKNIEYMTRAWKKVPFDSLVGGSRQKDERWYSPNGRKFRSSLSVLMYLKEIKPL
eukprot:TRINITY_DN12797_c0_g1_i1.p1 TRINITY_DN12797_c0_g1~~TRINITY_DN12797_c0_g1_i1.p1  ORF type:complete len:341 (-),score=104.39 TRINITY_DN12797_c0_g1_i1:13-1005(-)